MLSFVGRTAVHRRQNYDLSIFLSGAQAWIQELGTGAAWTRGGCVMISFECQPAQLTGAQIRLYFWVCFWMG